MFTCIFYYKASVLQFAAVNHITVVSSYQILYKNILSLWFEISVHLSLSPSRLLPHPKICCEMATFHTEEKASKCKINFMVCSIKKLTCLDFYLLLKLICHLFGRRSFFLPLKRGCIKMEEKNRRICHMT